MMDGSTEKEMHDGWGQEKEMDDGRVDRERDGGGGQKRRRGARTLVGPAHAAVDEVVLLREVLPPVNFRRVVAFTRQE